MKITVCVQVLAFILFTLVAFPAGADVQVSVTLSGPIDEILPILNQLKEMGVGTAAQGQDPLQLRVHSVFEGSAPSPAQQAPSQTAPTEAAPAPTAVAPEGFTDFSVSPNKVAPGKNVLLTVRVNDPQHAVDTVAATVGAMNGVSFDLYDNGSNGDKTAGDGVWSYQLQVPAGLTAKDYEINVAAFDAYGAPVMIEENGGKIPMQAKTTLGIQP